MSILMSFRRLLWGGGYAHLVSLVDDVERAASMAVWLQEQLERTNARLEDVEKKAEATRRQVYRQKEATPGDEEAPPQESALRGSQRVPSPYLRGEL